MPRKLLLLSNSTQHGSKYLEYCSNIVKCFFAKYDVTNVLFIPYALKDYDLYARRVKEAFNKMDLSLESIHEKPDAADAVKNASAVFIGGGNTFRLLKTLYDKNLIEVLRIRVLQDGIPYMGASAGTNMATISICTTNDMPIVYPPSFTALGFLPFNINPHYIDPDGNSTHMGETRATRIKEYHEEPGMPPVLGMREGCILAVDDNQAVIAGIAGARLFAVGKDPKEYAVGDDIGFLLSTAQT